MVSGLGIERTSALADYALPEIFREDNQQRHGMSGEGLLDQLN